MQVVSQRGLAQPVVRSHMTHPGKLSIELKQKMLYLRTRAVSLLNTVDEYLLIVDDAEPRINGQVGWKTGLGVCYTHACALY